MKRLGYYSRRVHPAARHPGNKAAGEDRARLERLPGETAAEKRNHERKA